MTPLKTFISTNSLLIWALVLSSCLGNNVDRPHRMDHTNYLYYVIETLPEPGIDPLLTVTSVIAPLGLHYVSPFSTLPNHFIVRALKSSPSPPPDQYDWELFTAHGLKPVHHPSDLNAHLIHRSLDLHPQILFVEPQIPRRYLFKRETTTTPSNDLPTPTLPNHTNPPEPNADFKSSEPVSAVLKRYNILDPGFPNQWHLLNSKEFSHDLNVIPAWSMNVTGRNITVAILDDGLDYTAIDLRDQFEPKGSYDYNDHQNLPTPKLSDDYHGTRCAGEVAAAINDVCGVGVAFNARVSGIRILSGELANADEARAFLHANQINDIYSCSFGPPDGGKVVEGPSELVRRSFKEGWHNGRRGLGSVFVFASGNGGPHQDNCNADGYTNLNWTLTIGATCRDHTSPWYTENCAAQLAVAYSGSTGSDSGIYTTDFGERKCTASHSGTSAAAPLGAGILALVLSARPDLTVRTLQYLIVHNAEPFESRTTDESAKWNKLPSGLQFSHKFGFGRLNAGRLVSAALAVKENVRPHVFLESPWSFVNKSIHSDSPPPPLRPAPGIGSINSTIDITAEMVDRIGGNATRTETVMAIVHIDHDHRGDLEIELISPHGVVSSLMTKRPYDGQTKGYQNWTFSSVQHWGENVVGTWTLRVSDWVGNETKGKFQGWGLQAALESRLSSSTSPTSPITTATATGHTTLATPTGTTVQLPTPTGSTTPPLSTGTQEGTYQTSTAVWLVIGLVAIGAIAGGLLKAVRSGLLSWDAIREWVCTHVPGLRQHGNAAQYEFQTLNGVTEADDREVLFDEFLNDDVDIDFDTDDSHGRT